MARQKRKPQRKKKARKVEKRKITREQFHKLVRKSAQPTRKPKSKAT
jgi:hypothetical protein